MKSKTKSLIFALLILSLVLVGCGGGGAEADPAATEDIPVVIDNFGVIAEGYVVPAEYVALSFASGGQVAEIEVAEGDMVEEGQVLANLADTEQLEAAVAGAELELLNAQQALDMLYENADLIAAQTLQTIANARDAIDYAEKRIRTLENGAKQNDLDAAGANLVLLQDQLDKAEEDYEPYADKPETNLTRATYQSRLAAAREAYDAAVRRLNNLEAEANDIDMAIAVANLAVAEAQMSIAESDYEKVQNGPDPDDLATAEASVKAAEAGVEAAKSALDNVILKAPFSGTVVEVNIKVGELTGSSQPAMVLADFSQWIIETDNLTEIEVPDVTVGQTVTVTPDALPDLELTGTVESIKDLFEEKRGDITYTVKISLDETDPRLRWGMTVVVTFDE
ncbi:MAG: HlyD family efflux transporter periplasmic adaptor subunit [Anaerolineales bacterium]|nr:HlyD family efflux transporter periplasmic adaptor subunit [Anaerolineales bacterium]